MSLSCSPKKVEVPLDHVKTLLAHGIITLLETLLHANGKIVCAGETEIIATVTVSPGWCAARPIGPMAENIDSVRPPNCKKGLSAVCKVNVEPAFVEDDWLVVLCPNVAPVIAPVERPLALVTASPFVINDVLLVNAIVVVEATVAVIPTVGSPRVMDSRAFVVVVFLSKVTPDVRVPDAVRVPLLKVPWVSP